MKSALILLTTACPVECEHCQYSCKASKEPKKWMSPELLERIAQECRDNDIEFIRISGGEPFYDTKKLFDSLDILLKYFKTENILLATSGFWATTEDTTRGILEKIHSKKIKKLEVSIDRFHIKKVPLKNIENLIKLSDQMGIKIVLRPLFDLKSEFLIEPIARLVKKYKLEILLSVTDSIGRAETFQENLIGRNQICDKFIKMIERSSV